MDFQDIVGLIIVVLISLVSSTKRRRYANETSGSESENTSVEEVRKRIESLKRERAQTSSRPGAQLFPPSSTTTQASFSAPNPQPVKSVFSAYKHLPEDIKTAPSLESQKEETCIKGSQIGGQILLESSPKAHPLPKLRSWILGQVILGKPVSLNCYHGNFEHR